MINLLSYKECGMLLCIQVGKVYVFPPSCSVMRYLPRAAAIPKDFPRAVDPREILRNGG